LLRRFDHRAIFAAAIFLLLLSGMVLGWMLFQTYESEQWVRHTYKVQLLTADIVFDINKTGRDRQSYLSTKAPELVQQMQDGQNTAMAKLARLKSMVQDNADQLGNCEKLEQAVQGRFATFDESLGLVRAGTSSEEAQDRYTQQLVQWSGQIARIAREIQQGESALLDQRSGNTRWTFYLAVLTAAFSFLLSLGVLWEHHRELVRELRQRIVAEQNALNLSGQLLDAQDMERRKIARDLHDGLGQLLAAAKMASDWLVRHQGEHKQKQQELSGLLDEAVTSTRSISHLLHPPLVDELGFVSAARSYLEGFSKRTGVHVSWDLQDNERRLPRDLELVFFRVLQETLTNIHRHSKSPRAEVQFHTSSREAMLQIRDFGVGLPSGMMAGDDSSMGVGLKGMKERVREHRGKFEMRSSPAGTVILVTCPLGMATAEEV